MAPDPALSKIQRWMQAVIVHPGTDEQAIRSPEAVQELPPSQAKHIVLPSDRLTATERIGIYRGMYVARLCEALEADYPALVHFLGKPAFNRLAERYVHEHPSRSYTLNRLGDHLPGYLQHASGLRRRGFVCDLARLELAMTEVFDEKEVKVLGAADLAKVPAEAWESARLNTIPALRLLSLRYPAQRYVEAIRRERRPPAISPGDARVAVYRNRYSLQVLELAPPAFDVLQELAAGKSLGESLLSAGSGRRNLEKRCFSWFRDWISRGLFQSIDL